MTAWQRGLTIAGTRPVAGFVSRFTTVAGLRLHVRSRVAPGPAWVLLHGLAVSHRYLMPTAAALTGGSVFVPDLPGFGLSSSPPRVLGPSAHAAVVAAWMDSAGLRSARLLGNSFGCQVAVELAVLRPDLVSALVLVGPAADPAAGTMAGQAWRWTRDLLFEDPRQARIIAADVRDAGVRRIVGTLRTSVRHRIDLRLGLVRAPVLVLRGSRDPIAPPGWVSSLGFPVADVPGAGHNAVTTAGAEVAARAMAFVSAG